MNAPFFVAGEDGPATLGPREASLMISSGWLSARFFPLPLELKDVNVRFDVPSMCRWSTDTNSAEDLIAISN